MTVNLLKLKPILTTARVYRMQRV